jgi:4-amino-4-deoxy-L-arabinose transferase-like glycosyltransferase
VNPPLFPLVLLPAGTIALLAYALRPRTPVTAPGRLTLARTAVVFGGYAVVSVELLSALRSLTTVGVAVIWTVALALAGAAAGWRHRQDAPGGAEPRRPLVERWHALTRTERGVAVAVAGLLLAELLLALLSPPNTYDSQTYHLPKIEHWAAQHDVGFYPVRIHRQVTYAPGAEYVLLHLRLLTGGDALYGLVQWSAGVIAVLAVTRLTGQLGGGRRAQLLAAFVLASAPAVVLEASSTQTDLVVAGWVACLATLALDGVGGRREAAPGLAGPATVLLLGVVTGLIAVTKQTGLFAAAPLLVWWGLARLRRGARAGHPVRAVTGLAACTLVILGITAAITGPYVWRVYSEFDNPLGPDYLRASITMQRHDPGALVVNGVRQAQSLLDTPVPYLSGWTAAGVETLARALGVNLSDPAITFDNTAFPAEVWYPSEDKAAYPVQALIMMVGAVACLLRPALGGARAAVGRRRAYASVVLVGLVLHSGTVKWQPWGNRLFLYLVVLAAPLAGLMLAAVFAAATTRRAETAATTRRADGAARARTPRVNGAALLAGFVTVTLVVGGMAGALSALYGWPRRLVGSQSVFVLDRWHGRFVTRPAWADQYTAVAAEVRASGAQHIGIIQQNDTWEYPWWLLLPGRQLLAVQSQLPRHRVPADQKLDAIVCAGPEQVCREWAPGGWQVRMYGQVGWALPPQSARAAPAGR